MCFINNANKISYRAFNSYSNKSEDFENVNKIPRKLKRADNNNLNNKKLALKYKDARLSYKNRRTINKDWKDFNNNVM
jgi:hypothetical protein